MDYPPLTGAACDPRHPFPDAGRLRRIDSMEYGEKDRGRVDGKLTMYDKDVTATMRMIAAHLWGQPCLENHITEVAADPILTTHLIAVVEFARTTDSTQTSSTPALYGEGAREVLTALHDGGLAGARRVVNALPLQARELVVGECVSLIMRPITAFGVDLGARFPR